MSHYDRMRRKRLGDVLVNEGVVSKESAIAALKEQKESHRILSDILLEWNEVTEWDLARVVVEQFQLPFIDLSRYNAHKDLIQSFPAALLHQAALVPLDRFGPHVCFACQELPSEALMGKLRQAGKGNVHFYVGLALEVRRLLQEFAPVEAAGRVGGTALFDGDFSEDKSWGNLFDAANEAVLSDLPEE